MIPSKTEERINDLQRNTFGIIQNPAHLYFGTDAVLLGGFMRATAKERVADLCTGNGTIPFLLSAKARAREIVAVEIQTGTADVAERSVAMNGPSERVRILCGDLREEVAGVSGSFDVMSCNPPYMALGRGERSQASSRAIVRQELYCTLEEMVEEAVRLLKNSGRAYLVYRPNWLDGLFATCTRRGFMPEHMKLARPFPDREANLVLLEAVRDDGHFLRMEVPIIVFRALDVYTDGTREIYGYQ